MQETIPSRSGLMLAVKNLKETIARVKLEKDNPDLDFIIADLQHALKTAKAQLKEKDQLLEQTIKKDWTCVGAPEDDFVDLAEVAPAVQPAPAK